MTKPMTTGIFTAGALALAIAGNSPAFGHGMRGHGACDHGVLPGGRRMLHALDLSADQQQKVRDILTAHRAALAPLAANEKAAKQAIADKLEGTGTVTPQDLDALVQQESQARTALLRERLAAALDVRSVLTPDQIQKAATIRAGVKDLRAQMRQLFGKQGAD